MMVFGGILTAGLQNAVLAGCGVAWACKPIEFLLATSQPMVSLEVSHLIVSGRPLLILQIIIDLEMLIKLIAC
jgi:hypothetical protein